MRKVLVVLRKILVGFIDTIVYILCAVLIFVFAFSVFPLVALRRLISGNMGFLGKYTEPPVDSSKVS